MTIGEKISSIRKQKKISQRGLGDMLGVSQSMIAQYETNRRIPKMETLKKFANALGCEVTDICDDNILNETYVKNEIAKAHSKFELEKLKEEQRRLEKKQDELMLYMYRLLSAEGRALAMDYVLDLIELQEQHQNDDKESPEPPSHSAAPE